MFITLETDYAIRIVAELCKDPVKLDAKSISDRSSVTLRFALKILRKLVAADIVKSYKGTQGGYRINIPPEKITPRRVVESIEGTYCFSRCLAPDGVCNRGASGKCSYQKAFCDITKTVRGKLDEYNFAMLTAVSNDPEEDNTDEVSQRGETKQQEI